MNYFFYLLIFTLFLVSYQFTLPFRTCYSKFSGSKASQHTELTDEENSLEVQCNDDCDCLTCNVTLPEPKKIINPYKQRLENLVPQKPFGSFCIKCAACLAVASEIETVIRSCSQECETDPEKKDKLFQDIVMNIDQLCSTGFKNFNLRAFGNHSIITNRYKCTTHIISNMDGNWTKKLRELCRLYISRIDIDDVSLIVLDSTGNLTDKLCRGTGIFRDCANIKTHEILPLPTCEDCMY